ncbi:MAG TPA: bifunctional alpha,alpha-trehalose-phosphate synthase (UDP-forming)/trehalose-phosphatase, partial [Bryobacteraceae bacterium]|nr:bifunctional alpha,alpha-trehalose-phosphate synthase (UDP-forming)/trehalose-phosphatase [Bryobacteraceae bacterium]
WPLFHHFPSRLAFDPKGWEAYQAANALFRDAVLREYRKGDLLWVHDYQLMLLPKMLRQALPEAAIGFFLHIPFPSPEVFRVLPEREEILEGLMGADFVAFQTYSHLQNFRSSLRRVLGTESRLDEVESGGRTVRLDALPIGIAPEEFTKVLSKAEGRRRQQELRDRYRDRQLLLAVDRMDYTKGIPQRLRSFRRLLERNPELHGKVVLLQVAVPSRERIQTFETLRRQVNELVGEINGQFATPSWTPVVYIRRGISRSELVALYSVADVAWVSPLRDGMNLVAKEYVACKKDADGVLILSEFAGAAEEMGEALQVNPNDEERTAMAVETALKLDPAERRRRMTALRERVQSNNVFAWSETFLKSLESAAADRGDSASDRPAPADTAAILSAYRAAQNRLLLLDYDGTLVGFHNRPEDAVPSPGLVEVLASLAADPRNAVMIISGRTRADLERWVGGVRGLWIAAEHGALLRRAGSDVWEPLRAEDPRPMLERVRPVLQHFVERTPGSFIEDKEFSLVWHYRQSESRFSDWLGQELVAMLEDMLAETELRAIRGKKIVEVRPGWLHKGSVARRFVELAGAAEFQLAAGDDRTDEDMFESLDGKAWTVHVGGGRSRARFAVQAPESVIALLGEMNSAGA